MLNKASLDLIKRWEGLELKAYKCSAGIVTIGYGTTAAAGVGITPRIGMTITKAEAEWYLERALSKFAEKIRPKITAPINDNEWAAFLSLAYNIGPTGFAKSSALRHFNNGDKAKAAASILLWNKAGGRVVQGLVNRRKAEMSLFLTPPQARTTPQATATPETPTRPPAGGLWAAIAAFFASLTGKATK